jgi:hypothetical protein
MEHNGYNKQMRRPFVKGSDKSAKSDLLVKITDASIGTRFRGDVIHRQHETRGVKQQKKEKSDSPQTEEVIHPFGNRALKKPTVRFFKIKKAVGQIKEPTHAYTSIPT